MYRSKSPIAVSRDNHVTNNYSHVTKTQPCVCSHVLLKANGVQTTGPVDVHHSQSLDMAMLNHQNNGDMKIPSPPLPSVPVDASVHVCCMIYTNIIARMIV